MTMTYAVRIEAGICLADRCCPPLDSRAGAHQTIFRVASHQMAGRLEHATFARVKVPIGSDWSAFSGCMVPQWRIDKVSEVVWPGWACVQVHDA